MNPKFNPGQFLIYGFESIVPELSFSEFVGKYPPAGFLLLGANYNSPGQMKDLIRSLKTITGPHTLFMVDQEPGRVQRFKKDFPPSKKPSQYLRQGTADYRTWCCQTAEMLAELGVNVNLLPVLDLWPFDKDYPVLNNRAFGEDPERVIEYAIIAMEEFGKSGIRTCAKHFPGLGAAAGDPHDVQAVSDENLERFLDYHWKPFKAVARAGIDLIMTTHLYCPALDPDNSATYSGNVISHLRNSVGFNGAVISDDLYMSGANAATNIGQSAINALLAGHDLLIISRDQAMQERAAIALSEIYENDNDFRKLSVDRAKTLKSLFNAN